MPGLFGIFEMSRRSLMSYQAAMATVGHNVANASVKGFHRQRVSLHASNPEMTALGALGTGVQIASVQRIESRFIDIAVQREVPILARYSARADVLAQTELIFGEPSDAGMTTVLDRFFDGWDDLASNAEDPGARESVVRLGMSLASSIRTARVRLVEQQASVSGEVARTVDDANRILGELRSVNQALMRTVPGSVAPDLEDQRDRLVGELGDLIGASATLEEDGAATVRVGGRVILQQAVMEPVALRAEAPAGPSREPDGTIVAADLGGRVAGLLEARDGDLESAIRRLDEFAVRLAEDVNGLHEQGRDLHGNAAGAFFVLADVGNDGVTGAAGVIDVSRALQDDANLVAAGSSGASGSNEVALDIAALRDEPAGLTGILRSLVVGVGSSARESIDLAEGQRIVVDSFRAQQEAISGVSLDEEAANLMQFQRAYQAAARVMTTADEMAQTILAM